MNNFICLEYTYDNCNKSLEIYPDTCKYYKIIFTPCYFIFDFFSCPVRYCKYYNKLDNNHTMNNKN